MNEAIKNDRFRFQLELSSEVLERLDSLVEITGSASRAETIRRALGFYWVLMNEAKAGNAVEIVSPNGKQKTLVVLEAAVQGLVQRRSST